MRRLARLVLGLALALLVAGCVKPNPYDGHVWDEWDGLQRPEPCDRSR